MSQHEPWPPGEAEGESKLIAGNINSRQSNGPGQQMGRPGPRVRGLTGSGIFPGKCITSFANRPRSLGATTLAASMPLLGE
jgi:hypothetical protein